MFNPHIHQQQQQQQQQQFQQHLRQLQQLFQQQPPPPPPQPPPGHHVPHHHHQAQRALSVPPQPAPNHRMVNMCQANQAAMMAPNAMLQGALLMQQMQGNMRGFGMGGQQFRQFFAAGSSLLGPVPMMGFPAARPYHQHARYYNNTPATANTASSSSFSSSSASITTTEAAAARHPDRKRDSDQMAAGSADDQPAASSTNEASDNTETDGAVGGLDEPTQSSDEQLEEPVVKKLRTEGLEDSNEQCAVETVIIAETDGDVLSSECNGNSEDSQPDDCILLEEGGSVGRSDVLEELKDSGAAEEHSCVSPSGRLSEDDQQVTLPPDEAPQVKDEPLASPDIQEEGDDGVTEGASKFYCYLCSITCHNQQNFKSHMNSVSHQQRMMEIQHMSNACLVTLLPRVQETLQGANKDGEKKEDTKHWCATCHTHFTSNLTDHRHTEEHKLASRTAISTCSVCKKRFRTTQIFVEHLQSQEHRQKVEKQLQENEGSEALGNPAAMDTDGFSVEEVEEEEEEERQGNEGDQDFSEKQVQDGCSSLKEVTLKNMASDEQYDPTTVYGSSFFAPVAGFLCRLCNKFYHFESSALHTHCKSLEHFENLKRYRESLSQKDEAVESSIEPPLAADSLRPAVTGTSTDCSEENSLCDEPSSAKDLNFKQPLVALERLDMPAEDQRQEEGAEPEDPSSQDLFTTSATSTDQDLSPHIKQEETTSEAVADDANEEKEGEKEMPAEDQRQEEGAEPEDPSSQDLFTTSATSTNGTDQDLSPHIKQEETTSEAVAEDANDEKEGEEEAPAVVPGKKSRTGKAKPKRRSGRAANRR